jgi:RecJ-like exonuclease
VLVAVLEVRMKKLFIAALLAAFAAVSLVAQEGGAGVSLLDVESYSKFF